MNPPFERSYWVIPENQRIVDKYNDKINESLSSLGVRLDSFPLLAISTHFLNRTT